MTATGSKRTSRNARAASAGPRRRTARSAPADKPDARLAPRRDRRPRPAAAGVHQPPRPASAAGRHLQARRRPHGRLLPAGPRGAGAARGAARAIAGRCATRRSHGCSARSCRPASRSRSRSRSRSWAPRARTPRRPCSSTSATRCARWRSAPIDEVFHEVEAGNADFGVVPIENSTEGTVNHTLDLLLTSPLHDLRRSRAADPSLPDGTHGSLERIARVCAHAQALAQCRGWLDEHLPEVERIAVSSNAEGARRARDELGTAAIAGATAAEIYGLRLLASEIEDRPDNTHALPGGRPQDPAAERRRQDDVAGVDEQHGGARRAVPPARAARRNRVNMTRIESRPAQAQVGLRVLHRHRGPRQRPGGGARARGA